MDYYGTEHVTQLADQALAEDAAREKWIKHRVELIHQHMKNIRDPAVKATLMEIMALLCATL